MATSASRCCSCSAIPPRGSCPAHGSFPEVRCDGSEDATDGRRARGRGGGERHAARSRRAGARSRAGSRRRRCGSGSTRCSCWRRAAGRRPAARRRRDRRRSAGTRRATRSPPTSAASSSSCSRPSRRSSSCRGFATASELLGVGRRPHRRADRAAGDRRGRDRPDRAPGRARLSRLTRSPSPSPARPATSAARSCAPATARARSAACSGWHGGRSIPPTSACARPSTGRATSSTATAVDALVADADVVVHLAFIIMGGHDEGTADQPRGLGERLRRGRRRGARAAARLHVVGRRLRLPPRQPAAADRGRPAARHRRALLLGREGRARGARCGSSIGDLDAYVFRPCIVAGPDALMPIREIPWLLRRSPDHRAPGPGRALPARPPRRRRERAGRRRPRGRPAGHLQPRRRRDELTGARPRPRARLAQPAGPARRRLARRRRDRAPARPGAGAVAERVPHAGADVDRTARARSSAGARATTRRETLAADRRRRPRPRPALSPDGVFVGEERADASHGLRGRLRRRAPRPVLRTRPRPGAGG